MTHRFLAVSGGRYYADQATVDAVLHEEYAAYRFHAVVQGECPYGGADRLARDWCERNRIPCFGLPAHFKNIGKIAGPIRNGWMLDLLPVFKLVAFPGDRGTADAMTKARKRQLLVRDVTLSPTINHPHTESDND